MLEKILSHLTLQYDELSFKEYLHFLSYLRTLRVKVVKIIPHEKHIHLVWIIPWLLMSWPCKDPGHQQLCYQLSSPSIFFQHILYSAVSLYTVEYRYNMVQYSNTLHRWLQNLGRISIRCCYHKRHFCEHFWENGSHYNDGTALCLLSHFE